MTSRKKAKAKTRGSKPLFVVQDGGVTVGNWRMFQSLSSSDPIGTSIKKWEFIAKRAGRLYRGQVLRDGKAATCGLCEKFSDNGICRRCPVFKHTGSSSCSTTPYYRYMGARNADEAAHAARAEVEFLESLRK